MFRSRGPARSCLSLITSNLVGSTLCVPKPRWSPIRSYASSTQGYDDPNEGASLSHARGKLLSVEMQKEALLLRFEKAQESVEASYLWLRDSCQSSISVSPTGQKRFATSDVPRTPLVESAQVTWDGKLEVFWKDDFMSKSGGHRSVYSPDLFTAKPQIQDPPRSLWNAQRLAEMWNQLLVSYNTWMEGGNEFQRKLYQLYQYGIIVIDDVPKSRESVANVARQIGILQNTIYGETWDVVSKPNAENIAYTSDSLGLHQDLLYWHDTPRLQLLHCLENECSGGESLFSDGLKTAYQIQSVHPNDFARLRKYRIRYHYDRDGHSYHESLPVLQTHPSSQDAPVITDIAWSPPFQDIQPRGSWFLDWRDAATKFSNIAASPENLWAVRAKPGQCVIFDNARILHGRRQFDAASGHRWLRGAYVQKQVFRSKLLQNPEWLAKAKTYDRTEDAQAREAMSMAEQIRSLMAREQNEEEGRSS